jgi:hypothetical protein
VLVVFVMFVSSCRVVFLFELSHVSCVSTAVLAWMAALRW